MKSGNSVHLGGEVNETFTKAEGGKAGTSLLPTRKESSNGVVQEMGDEIGSVREKRREFR